MKILHVVPSYKPAFLYGGPVESVSRLCEALQAAGHSVTVFTTTANGKEELAVNPNKEQIVDGIRVTYFARITKDPTHISPRLWWALYKHCHQYDVVHIHSWWNILVIVASMICHWRRARVVISPRGMLSEYIMTTSHGVLKKWIHALVGKPALRKATFHATSDLEYTECLNVIPGWQGFMLPNILQLPGQQQQKTKNDVFTMLYLSRIHPKKGLELLFEAMSHLQTDVRLRIAGKGDEQYIQELKNVASRLNISSRVDWIGWKDRSQKFTELVNADAFVLTSFNENFANVVIESLSVGTPVIISNKVGLSDYVIKNKLGWVTDLHVQSITEAINEAVTDETKRHLINQNARTTILHNFSEPVVIQQYIDEYRSVTGKSRSD